MCKGCKSTVSKQSYPKRRDKILKQQKEYRATGKHAANNRKYRRKNRNAVLAKQKAFRENNPEKCNEYARRWRSKNPEKVRALVRRRRERKRKLDANFTHELELKVRDRFSNKCFKCNSNKRLELDHHNALVKGNGLSLTNAVLLCRYCNSSKGAKDPKDFYNKKQLKALSKFGIK